MANEIVQVAGKSLPVLEYQGRRVITLAMMDDVHGRPVGTAGRNFRRHRERLRQGEDYYDVPYIEYGQQVNGSTKFVEPSDKVGAGHKGNVILLTEFGYMLLVKCFRDDLAWEVQRQLS